MNPWIVALATLFVGAALGSLATIAFRRGRGGGGDAIVAPAPAQARADEAQARAEQAREDAAGAEIAEKEGTDADPVDWINDWARRARPGAGDDDPDPSRGG